MKKILIFSLLIASIFLFSACVKQKPEDLIWQGSTIPQQNKESSLTIAEENIIDVDLKTEEIIKQFKNPTLIVASEGDSYSADSSKVLNSLSKNSILKIYKGSEHGTRLLARQMLIWLLLIG